MLTELSAAYRKPYFDFASEILLEENPQQYGGRVCVAWDGNGCLVCYRQLDLDEAAEDLTPDQIARERDEIYGVDRTSLGRTGPSVVSINGVIASIGVTEFMLVATGQHPAPRRLLTYLAGRGRGGINASTDKPDDDCYYCKAVWGKGDAANVQRYLQAGIKL